MKTLTKMRITCGTQHIMGWYEKNINKAGKTSNMRFTRFCPLIYFPKT